MSVILTRGRVPKTPHTEHYSEPEVLALEEIHGVSGFSGDKRLNDDQVLAWWRQSLVNNSGHVDGGCLDLSLHGGRISRF